MPKRGQELMERIRRAGIPLGEFAKGRYYWGVKTGFNEAFVVDRNTRDRLIAEDSKSSEILKPLLRGRDVKRWCISSGDLWLIFARRGIDISEYPAIKKHLAGFRKQLEPKPNNWPKDTPWEGRKPGSYKWYEIQDNIAYWQEFAVPKIITPAITDRPNFCPDDSGFFSNNKTSIYVVDQPFAISALCNSAIGYYYAKLCYASKEGGFFDFEPRYSSTFPIAVHTQAQAKAIDNLARLMSFLANHESHGTYTRDPLMRDYYETILNALIYELYLPDELHAAGLNFFDLVKAAEIPDVAKLPKTDTNRLVRLREHFEAVYAPSHPLRAALQKLRTLDPIRVIEGKS
jgi:adenine-specific DNA-methyltransferase